jgi:putative PEP-CTERM system histidine kinase
MNLTLWSHLVSALAFALLAWRLPHQPALRRPMRIRIALLVCLLWSLLVAMHGGGTIARSAWLGILIPLAGTAHFAALLLLLDTLGNSAGATWLRRVSAGLVAVAALFAVAGLIYAPALQGYTLMGLLLALAGLVHAEQLLRNSPPAAALAIRFCVVGIGGQLTYELFLFSQAQLLGGFDAQSWALRGFVYAGLVPLLGIGLSRLAREKPTLFVSRQMVFYTTAFLIVGVYLVLMALGGYYVRVHGGSWGESLRMLFFAGSMVVLAMLVLSPSLWRRWRVFVAKHFYRNKYDYRVEWLRFIETLSSHTDPGAQIASIRAIAQILESPGGLLFLRGEDNGRFDLAARWSLDDSGPLQELSLDAAHDLPRFLADRQWVIDVREYRGDPDVYRNIALPAWLIDEAEGWRIVTPLLELDHLIGFLVLQAPPEPFKMTFEDRDLLRTVGRHVATLLAQQAADRKLAESQQFNAFNRFAAFVMHDLKNSVAQLQLLASNAARHRDNPAFMDDAIETISNSAARMTRLIEQLRSPAAANAQRAVDIAAVLKAVVQRCMARPPGIVAASMDAQVDRAVAVMADAERLSAVLEHVIRNAQEAVGAGGQVRLQSACEAGSVIISVNDNGPGMDAQFIRDRLFRPFDSTKGSKGMGIGAYQVRDYVRQLGGTVEVQSAPGAGTTFLIRLPLCQPPNPAS